MEYNTTKEKITVKEYGRHVQSMVDYLLSIEDRDLRTQQAKATIRTMSCFSMGMKDSPDYWQKLWDHLYLISDFKLDVDSPFPKPEPTTLVAKPDKIAYQKNRILFPPYGKLIENIIQSVAEEPDSEIKDICVENIAIHLKKQYLIWNRDSVNDNLIVEQLYTLSNGKLKLKEGFQFPSTKELLEQMPAPQTNQKKILQQKKKKNMNNNNKSNKNYKK